MKRLFAAFALVGVFHSSPATARADVAPSLRWDANLECVTPSGKSVTLAPGRYMPEQTWQDHDAEYQRLQVAETRLKAENEAFREDAEGLGLGWGTVVLVGASLVTGVLIGVRL